MVNPSSQSWHRNETLTEWMTTAPNATIESASGAEWYHYRTSSASENTSDFTEFLHSSTATYDESMASFMPEGSNYDNSNATTASASIGDAPSSTTESSAKGKSNTKSKSTKNYGSSENKIDSYGNADTKPRVPF
jgi:hypothetical protein